MQNEQRGCGQNTLTIWGSLLIALHINTWLPLSQIPASYHQHHHHSQPWSRPRPFFLLPVPPSVPSSSSSSVWPSSRAAPIPGSAVPRLSPLLPALPGPARPGQARLPTYPEPSLPARDQPSRPQPSRPQPRLPGGAAAPDGRCGPWPWTHHCCPTSPTPQPAAVASLAVQHSMRRPTAVDQWAAGANAFPRPLP